MELALFMSVLLEEDNPTRFFPVELLAVGKEFCKAWYFTSQMNDEFGGQYYASSYLFGKYQVGFFGQRIHYH